MNDHGTKPYYLLTLSLIGMIALSVFLWRISVLTGGPENGGRFDVPAVNVAAWWGFLVSIPGVLVVGNQWLTRLEQRIASRHRKVGPDRRSG